MRYRRIVEGWGVGTSGKLEVRPIGMGLFRFLVTALVLSIFVFWCGAGSQALAQDQFPFQNPNLPLDQRLDDLLSRMTIEEKIDQMLYEAPAIERLGIPEYNWWNECLHGVGRAGLATVFPQAIGMAASWDTDLVSRVATVISDEARAKHHEFARQGKRKIYQGLTFWTPNINIFRDPRWGRGQETYGEDPYLTSRTAVSFIRGLQGDDPKYLKLVATAKHFAVHSGPEPDRHTFDAQTNDRDLYETYLPAFEASVNEADVESVMCAYNRFRGEAACASNLLLGDILRKDWGFDGYVVSDCWAIVDIFRYHKLVETPEEAAAMSVIAGTDVNCGSTYPALKDALKKGLIDEAAIDTAVRRLFDARFRLGMFDPPEMVKWAQIPYSVNNSESHKELALEAAHKSIVLLKNEGGLLPLKAAQTSIAVIGPNADDRHVLQGNYNGTAEAAETILTAIRAKVWPQTKVYHSKGSLIAPGVRPVEPIPSNVLRPANGDAGERGLRGTYHGNRKGEGDPSIVRVDPVLNFVWRDQTPITGEMGDEFSVIWEGYLVPEVSGHYRLGLNGLNACRLLLDGRELVKSSDVHRPQERMLEIGLEAGRFYALRIEFTSWGSDPQLQLLWSTPSGDYMQEAVAAANKSDVVVFVGGLSPQLEGEEMPVKVEGFSGGDRTDIKLPKTQEEVLQRLAETGKPIILVLMNGSAVSSTWADENIPVILSAWYPGQAGGAAVADVLFGDYNPGGRLPVTFYRSVADLPDFSNYDMEGRTYRYFKGQPLYPFGHGLSYTNFTYDGLKATPESLSENGQIKVSIDVTNAGSVAGDEVVQLYVSDIDASVPVPIRSLQGYRRVHLDAGETKSVEFTLEPKQFSLITDSSERMVEAGEFLISVGGKQPGFSGTADAASTQVKSIKVQVSSNLKIN